MIESSEMTPAPAAAIQRVTADMMARHGPEARRHARDHVDGHSRQDGRRDGCERGAPMKYAKVYAEDVNVGDELPPLVKGPIQQIQLTRYAGASGDFNPIHQDDEFAKAAGMGGVFAHGMLSMGFVAQ